MVHYVSRRLGYRFAAWLSATLLLLVASSPYATGKLAPRDAQLESRRAEDADLGTPDEYPSLLITNPRVVAQLELEGLSFGDVFGIASPEIRRRRDYEEESAKVLSASSPMYGGLVGFLSQEIVRLGLSTPKSGVGGAFKHRFFDRAWLTSAQAHFELVGVVNRMDFRGLLPPGCGQTRLVYRLALRPSGRPPTWLPMTVNVEYENSGPVCMDVARQWLSLEGADRAELARRVLSGPLARLQPKSFDHVEVNLQVMRENAERRGMDDHGEYILRSFDAKGDRLEAVKLRNAPSDELEASAKDDLVRWSSEHLGEIEAGTAEVPGRFLTERESSVTSRGLSRLANRPFKRLFPDEVDTFGGLAFDGKTVVTSPAALVRRLDEMTCAGCHQSRSIAGFHLLGEQRSNTTDNALVLGFSEHLREMLPWRHRFLLAAAVGHALAEPLPMAERPDDEGGYGAHCNLSAEGAPRWSCAAGYVCKSNVDGDPIGECMPEAGRLLGDPCEPAALRTDLGPDGDVVTVQPTQTCSSLGDPSGSPLEARCNSYRNGFPGGLCTATCTERGERIGAGVCTHVPHRGFERECFKKEAVLETCLEKPGNGALELLRSCSRTKPCRDDYTCARAPGLPPDEGVCAPPYFLFQVRVDGPPIDRRVESSGDRSAPR